jgi:hypothetical protein
VLDPIGEKNNANAIVVLNRGHRQDGGELARQLALESSHRPESLRTREIDDQHYRELALLDITLDERSAHPSGNVPVDRANLVTWLILADLRELHPLPFEHRAVFAGKDRVDQAAGAQLDELHLPQNFRRHSHWLLGCALRDLLAPPARAENPDHGTGIASKMRATISSLVTSSASAS